MSNILVLGVGPLPIDPSTKLYAPGLRTWQFAQVLAKHDHNVTLGIIEFGDFKDSTFGENTARRVALDTRIELCRLTYHSTATPQALAGLHRAARFNCIVSTTDLMNNAAAGMGEDIPMWLDYNGDPFAEKQLQGAVHGSDAALLDQWRMILEPLILGDRFSTCSEAQRCALIGQLGFAGRLNQYTSGEELVSVILACSTALQKNSNRTARLLLRGRTIPTDAFMLMWSGGYNTWCDPETLAAGVMEAMRRSPRVYYVSTGGAIEGHDDVTFRRFKETVRNSDLAERFHFVGWVPTELVSSYYEHADLALNVDSFSYEGELGTRTRIVDWIQYGCPVLTTEVCDFARDLAEKDLVNTFEVGNPQSLAGAIMAVVENPDIAAEKSVRAKSFFEKALDEDAVHAELLKWATAPKFARDRQAAIDAKAAKLSFPPPGAEPTAPAEREKIAVSALAGLLRQQVVRLDQQKLASSRNGKDLRGLWGKVKRKLGSLGGN